MQSTSVSKLQSKHPVSSAQACAVWGLSMALSTLATFEREQIHTMLTSLPSSVKTKVKQELSVEIEDFTLLGKEFTLEQLGLSFYHLLLAHYERYIQTNA